MRFALALLALPVLATDGAAQSAETRLSWSEAAELGSEAVILIRTDEGTPLITLRERVDEGSTNTRLDLPALTTNAASIQAGLVTEGRVVAQSAKSEISVRDFDLDLSLRRAFAVGFSDIWACADQQIVQVTWGDGGLRADTDGTTAELTLSEVDDVYLGSGGNRVAFGGNVAEISLAGQDLGTCRPMLFAPVLPMQIAGADSSWRLHLGADDAELTQPDQPEDTQIFSDMRMSAPRDGTIRIAADGLELRLHDNPCRTSVTNLLYPVEVQLAQPVLDGGAHGCGGNALDLLAGPTWEVTSLFGVPFGPDMPAMTLQVTGAQISGRTSCNRYLGRATIADDRLTLRELGTTRLACPTNKSNLELRFLDALEGATGFDIWQNGSLTLRAGPFPLLTARRR